MKYLLLATILIFNIQLASSQSSMNEEKLEFDFKELSKKFDDLNLNVLPLKDRGRLKPLDTVARENNLFLTGKRTLFSLSPVSFYMGLHLYKDSHLLKIVNIRNVELREQLGFDKNRTLFSLEEIEKTNLMSNAQSAFEVEKKNKNLLTPIQSAEIELVNQTWLLKSVMSGDLTFQGLVYTENEKSNYNQSAMQNLLMSIASNESSQTTAKWANELVNSAMTVNVDPQFKNQRERMSLEVVYNKWKLFFISGLLYFIISFISFLPYSKKLMSDNVLSFVLVFPLLFLAIGFGIRVYITEFPPVTNMYGTMIWVAFGISLFSYLLYLIYKDRNILAIMSLGASLLLILTENIPLIISPNMDPIVAVLRSSYWLTIHVLTVTISYAAFSMAMILGNIYIIKNYFKEFNEEDTKRFAHYTYRSIQLGVFLLTAGIILGGVWADYSWGRFWGWDPKETWALIADLGFLVLLHGRFAGWISPKKILFYSPLAYILVIMAWFGVNFILATGLHSYGFSSGGTFMVIAAVALQLAIYLVFYAKKLVFNTK